MSENKLQVEGAKPVNDEELNDVNGGSDVLLNALQKIWSTSYSYCGYYNGFTGEISYYPCSQCRNPMYTRPWYPQWVCDKCHNKEFYPQLETWHGTRSELISAADG